MPHRLILNKEATMNPFDWEWRQVGSYVGISFVVSLIVASVLLFLLFLHRNLRSELLRILDMRIQENTTNKHISSEEKLAKIETDLAEAKADAAAANKKYDDLTGSILRSEASTLKTLETLKKLDRTETELARAKTIIATANKFEEKLTKMEKELAEAKADVAAANKKYDDLMATIHRAENNSRETLNALKRLTGK